MDNKMEFVITGIDYEKLVKFQKAHRGCLEKHPNMTAAQFCYTFTSDSFGTISSCQCVCGKSITMSSDYDGPEGAAKEAKFRVLPEDAKTEEITRILQSMHVRPGMYFGKQRSYISLRSFLFGYNEGARAQGEGECYWLTDLVHDVDRELVRMTEGRKYSDEEMFDKYFEAFDLVLKRDYPQYIMDMSKGDKNL